MSRAMVTTVLLLAGVGLAQDRPSQRTPSCLGSGCHVSTIDHAVLHGPAAVGACTVCHDYASPQLHTFRLKEEGRNLCDFCHIDKVGTEGAVVHQPVAEGDCLACHDPHGGADHALMRLASVGEQCASCHPDAIRGSHVHTPVAEGRCTDCHEAHTARHPGLLEMTGRDMCLSCHSETAHAIASDPVVHQPLQGECTQCHTAHASDVPRQLLQGPRALCSSCHQNIEQVAMNATHRHSAVLDERACLNCHTPHSGVNSALLPTSPAEACRVCHSEPITDAAGVVLVPAAHDLLSDKAFLHGAAREGRCGGCHDVHGAAESRLLTATYTDSFYQSFSLEAYALCFKCHDSALATEERTFTATGFRDGDRNLHYLHVNRETGRTCRACHATHAADNPFHVAETVRFGQWDMPQNFKFNDTGGTCATGCHQAKSYLRGEAVPAPPVE